MIKKLVGVLAVGLMVAGPVVLPATMVFATTVGGVNLGNLPDYLFVFTGNNVDTNWDANWQGASKGFLGDVAIDGIAADERTSGFVPYAGTIYTNDTNLGDWQQIVDDNPTQASGATGHTARITGLRTDLTSAFTQIDALPATAGYSSVSAGSLNGLNTQDGIDKVYVINVTSGFSSINSKINITGDTHDVFFLRWDTDANFSNGYQGQVKFQSGGGIVPLGDLTPTNFINVAGDIKSSGGGSNPAAPYPQGPRHNNGAGALITGGADWNGGGFFTGYWLTTGDPSNGETSSLSNGIFVGGWYSSTVKFSMTSGTSGVYVAPNPDLGGLKIVKFNDLDKNGIFDGQDYYMPDWEFLVSGNGYSNTVVTGQDGTVTLTGLAVQQYTITETLQDGWDATTANPQYATVVPNSVVTIAFGNAQAGGGDNVPEPAHLGVFGAVLTILSTRHRKA